MEQSSVFSKMRNKKRLPQCDKRLWCLEPESNQRHEDFQSSALPTELSRLKKRATQKGLEPSTSSVTGWHSNRLNYCAILKMTCTGFEPVNASVKGW